MTLLISLIQIDTASDYDWSKIPNRLAEDDIEKGGSISPPIILAALRITAPVEFVERGGVLESS